MKKIIGILAILFITTGVFGQIRVDEFSEIETSPTRNNTTEDWIRKSGFGEIKWENGYGKIDGLKYVHFIRGDWMFMLAYEPKKVMDKVGHGCRGLYLYKKNINDSQSSWEKASAVLLTSCSGTLSYDEVDFFLAEDSFGSLGNVEVKDDCVEVTVGWYQMDMVHNDCVKGRLVYQFVPSGYGGYLFDFKTYYK